jgi:hypothetical protein
LFHAHAAQCIAAFALLISQRAAMCGAPTIFEKKGHSRPFRILRSKQARGLAA